MKETLKDIADICTTELRRIWNDKGVTLIFLIATLLYPLIFGAVYKNEMVRNVPIAVVDESQGYYGKRFIHKIDATPEINISYKCNSMEEAKQLMKARKINGILLIPRDYERMIAGKETARICLFCDMSSFLYYRSVLTGASGVLVDEMQEIQLERYALAGITGESADELVQALPYEDVKLYSPGGGFKSFLVPALLVLVIHQTLFLGISILFGTSREEKRTRLDASAHLRDKWSGKVVIGRATALLLIYIPLVAIDLVLVPMIFGLPHIGRLGDLCLFILPFLLATIFFCMTVCSFVRERDSGIVTCIFFSVPLLFMSGAVWPPCGMPSFWKYFSYIFPSTHGIQGFIRINTMGATLPQVRFEYLMLWLQVLVYFITSCVCIKRDSTIKQKELRYYGNESYSKEAAATEN